MILFTLACTIIGLKGSSGSAVSFLAMPATEGFSVRNKELVGMYWNQQSGAEKGICIFSLYIVKNICKIERQAHAHHFLSTVLSQYESRQHALLEQSLHLICIALCNSLPFLLVALNFQPHNSKYCHWCGLYILVN